MLLGPIAHPRYQLIQALSPATAPGFCFYRLRVGAIFTLSELERVGDQDACRHPPIALRIAAANLPDERFGRTIILYLLVSAIVGIPYVAWQRRRLLPAPSV